MDKKQTTALIVAGLAIVGGICIYRTYIKKPKNEMSNASGKLRKTDWTCGEGRCPCNVVGAVACGSCGDPSCVGTGIAAQNTGRRRARKFGR